MTRSVARGFDKTQGRHSKKFDNIAQLFAETVTGEYNQDISFLMVGKKGTGKSYCQLSLAYHTACHIAEIVGGHWSDYFDMDACVAIVDPDRANEIMGYQERYAVKIYDDIGVGWGARDWQKEENKAKNDVFQINRVDNQVQMFSVPNQFLLDKVPRSLVSHYAETYQQYFKQGFVTIKMFEPQTLFREGKIIQPYLYINRRQFVLYAIQKPPSEISKRYNQMRLEVTRTIVQMRKERIKEKSLKETKPKIHPRTKEAIERAKPIVKLADQIHLKGQKPLDALIEAGESQGISPNTTKYWVKRGITKSLGYTI